MACKYKYKDKWYSEIEVKNQILKDISLNDVIVELSTQMSYTVEINTAKEISKYSKTATTESQFYYDNATYEDRMWDGYFKNNVEISQEEFQKASKEYHSKRDTETQPTQYYSNLTVPGGTNYTENAIQTPNIINSSTAHVNDFAKGIANMLGWFRSDEVLPKAKEFEGKDVEDYKKQLEDDGITGWEQDMFVRAKFGTAKNSKFKTRRILEVQSDLFQKGRDRENLTATLQNKGDQFVLNGVVYDTNIKNFETGEKTYTKRNENFGWDKITREEYEQAKEVLNKENKENQFLQLLNKDNNWVTFFVKSIIQDSAKKGYEKVLFPRLATIIQIESQNRFKTYAEAEAHYKDEKWYEEDKKLKEKLEEARKELKDKKEEVAKIKSNPNYDKTLDYDTPIQNLERLASQAYEKWHSVQPTLLNTANFYEYELANRLDDIAGGNKNNRAKGIWALNQITDEYGNTWNEVTVDSNKNYTVDLLPLTDEQASTVVNSFKNTILVPGLTANQQQEIVNDIAYLLQRKVLEANGKTINGRDVHAEYKAYLESLLAITTGKRKEVIQAVIDNYKSIENISYKYFSKLQGVQVKENVDNLFSKGEEDTKVNVDEETDIANETESNLEKTTFEDSSLTQNYKNTISSRLKKFLSFIKTGEKNFVYSPKFVPFDEVYNTLKQVLSGERPDFDGMVKELEKNIISKPWLQDVVTQLNAAPGETKNDFVSAMTSHTVNMTFLMWQKDANGNYKLTPYSSNSVSISNMVVDNWYETGKLASVVIDKEGELVYNPEVVAKYKVAVQNLRDKKLEDITVTDVANTLAIVGIELHPDAVKMFLNKGLSGQSFKSHLISKTGIFANLSNKLSSTNDIVTDNYLGDKSITKLAYLEAKFNKNVTDSSFKSGTKSISAHTLNKHITNQVRELKNNRKLVTDLLSISFSKDSSLLKGLVFTEVTEDVKNEAEKVTGSREVTVNEQGVVIASDGQVIYNKDSYFYQNFNFDYLGIEAIKEFGKSSKEGSELKNISAAEHELIKIGLFMKSSLTQDSKGTRVAQMFYPTMSDKTTMINITTILHNISFTPDGALGNKTIDALFEALVLPEYNRMVNYKKTNVKGYDEGHALFYFLPQLNDRKELFHEDGTIKDLTSDKDALIIIKNEIRSTVEELVQGKLAEWETYQFTKDAYLDADYMKNTAKKNIKYAATDYVVNYLIHNSNMFQSFIGDPALYFKSNSKDNITKIEDTFINIGKRLAGDIAPGYELNNAYKDTFKAVVIADRKSVSESIEYYNKVLTEQGAKDYTKIEAGDAQEYTTLREHLKVMYGLGKITEKEFNRINKLAEEGKDLSDADLAVILQPMKPVYVANKIELHNDLNRRIYIKSSSFPLVPQLTRGLQIDNLRIAMEHPTKGVDRVSFGTAAKVGAPSNQLNIFDANGDFKTDINFDETEVLTLSRSGFRIQQEVPYDKEKIPVGTQERKLLFVNLLDTPGFNYKDKKNLTGKQLQEIYTDKYHKLFQLQHKSLMEELEFNESTGKVNTSKLQKLLKKEAIERDFPINDLLGLELDRNGEFRIPLWLLPSTSRYESLLNAIVDNRVRKMKFNGGSFILGSEEGFKEKTTIVTDKEAEIELEKYHSDIVFTDSWTGKLKGTTETGMTQALIPFKFRDSKGELLDIANYTIKKDGKLVLNTDKLPKDLLKIFGFRIPTQGLNSMAQIEIVGFLPVSAGDLIITSKDFTKQMGSDFDVDKLYSYIYSHFTDSFGNIHKITTDNISKLLDLSQIKDDKKEDLTNWIIGLYDTLQIEYTEEDLKDKDLSKLKAKLEMLAIHNDILDIHHAVLENTHEDVRKQMLTPLGFGDLKDGKDLANLIASWKKARSGTQRFIGLSDSYQKQKFLNATDGKGGTGVFSLDSVFNSLVQDKDLHYIIADADGFNTFSVKFGTLESTGFLSDPKTLDGKKYKSDVIAAYQSASVDNEKEQILDKLNINSNTYDTIRILAQLGFDEETISAFTNQDIIVDFVKEIKLQKSSLYGYQPDLEATIIEQLTKKYTKGIDTKSESFINAVIAKKNISTEELMSYIQNGNTNDTFGYAAAQIAALSKFKQLTEYGKTLKRIQSAINTDSAGLGKSLFASIAKEDSIRNLQNSPVKNAEKLIGNYTIVNGKLEIEPTTINGFATVYGLFTNNALWSKYFPYGHENITNIVTEINKVTSDKEMDTAQKEEVYKNVFGAIKSYLFTRKDLGIFDGDLKARREWLFKNLGKRINEFKINKVKLFETNPFLNKLTTETDLKSGLKILKYNAVSLESFFEDSIYGGFLDLIQKNTEIADGYTTRQLADDLVQYAYLSGGKQQAVDFIRYIPIEYLNQLPFANKLRNINFSDTNVLDNIQRSDKVPYYQVSEFVKQYVQHNSRKVPEFPANTKVEYTNKEKTQFTIAKDAITLSKMPTFVNFNDKLWQFNGQNYTQISKLGGKYQIGEYDANSRGITSIINKQNPKQLVVTPKADSSNSIVENTTKKPYEDVIVARNNKYKLNSGDITAVLDAITTNSTNPAYKRLAQEYLDVISKLGYKIDIKLSDVNAFGRTSYNKNGKGNVLIEINNSNAIDSVEFLEKTILHETTHALTKFLIVADKDTLTTQQKEIVEKLDKFRNAYKQRVNAKLVDFVQAKVKNKESLTDFERNILYPGINLEEFTAAAMENEEFQKFLAKEIWQGDKTMLDKFFELMKDLMKSLGINVGEDLNKYIYSDVLNLIKSQVKETPTQVVDSGIDAKTLKRGDIIEFQQQNFQIERVTEEGFDVRDVNTGEVDFITKEDYESENKKELKPNVANNKDTQAIDKNQLQKQNITPQDFTNHSGGAIGSDALWDQIGREYGFNNHNHYREPMSARVPNKEGKLDPKGWLDSETLRKNGIQGIDLEEETHPGVYREGQQKATIAARQLGRIEENHQSRSNYIIRNWAQVKNSDAIYAVGTIIPAGTGISNNKVAKIKQVKGGTGYAVQMAINEKKPVFVYDGTKNSWFEYDYASQDYVKTETPTLTKNYAGIGSRSLSTQEVWDKSMQAMRDVYQTTLDSIDSKEQTSNQYANIEKDYDFKYFGTTYEIETTNGIATDVLSLKQWASETNTKFQERKQKILDAYNDNKDVDKQTGRKFRNLTINEEFHTVEKTPIVEKSESEKKSFTYKGRTIETAFELTDGQSNALKSLIDFSSNSSTTKAITLQGPAGTGKTATIGYLQKYLGGDSKLIYLAPTHAATAELAFATVKTGNKSLPLTVASSFRKGINRVTGEEEALMTKKLLDRLSYGNNILVVDEVSMLNGKDYALILETIKNKPNIKLIFMGDILQIPEVNANNPDKKQVSKAFTEHAQVVLSEVKRTSSNSILQILTNLRKYTNGLIPKVKNTEQVQYVDDNGFDQLIVETFKKDPENSVLISYTNAGVKATNRKIREVLGRTGDLKKDDIITGYLGYSSKQIEKGNIANSIRFKVENVEKDGSEYIITASSEKLKSLRTQGVSGVPTTFSGIYLQLSPSDAFTFDELTDDDFEENNKKLSVMMAELHTTKQAAIKNPRMWSTYYDLQTSIGAHLAKVNLGDDYIYNPKTNKMEKYDSNKHSKIDADLKIEKGVDFGHAVTVHKSQGSTFKNVFFDTATLPKGNSSKLYRGEDLISSEKHALIYVAMSRASDLLVVRASDSSLFYDVLERKNMPEVVSQKEIQPDIEETLEDFLPVNNKFSKNTLELTKNVLSLFETEDTIENYKNRCK